MKHLTAIAACGLLAGCAAVPMEVTLISQAADGMSYLESGKSITDHLLSSALDQDCALFRIVQGKDICTDKKSQVVAKAASGTAQVADNARSGDPIALPPDIATLAPDPGGVARAADAQPAPIVAAFSSEMFFTPAPVTHEKKHPASKKALHKAPAADKVPAADKAPGKGAALAVPKTMPPVPDIEPAAGPMTPATPVQTLPSIPASPPQAGLSVAIGQEPQTAPSAPRAASKSRTGVAYFVVLGSFSHKSTALRTARHMGGGARVSRARVKGRQVWRVVVGPFDRRRARAKRNRFKSSGAVRSAWLIRSCAVPGRSCLDAASISR